MIVKPESFKKLIGIKRGRIAKVPVTVMRKPFGINYQDKYIRKQGICITCDYRFYERKINWSSKVKAICHPFKKTTIFPEDKKCYLLSESDFCDELLEPVDVRMSDWDEAAYDFVYFTLLSRQGIRCKGLYLLEMIDNVATDMGLRGVVINYNTITTSKHRYAPYKKMLSKIRKAWKKYKSLKTVSKCYTPKKVCAIMKSCKFVIFPNDADASPRLIPEALIRNTPVVVNSAIYGGWKYVGPETGSFFSAPTFDSVMAGGFDKKYLASLKAAIESAMEIDRTGVAAAFYADYGFSNSVKTFAQIINEEFGTSYKAVAFRDWKAALYKVAKHEGWIE